MRIHFNGSPTATVGVEVELQIIDPVSEQLGSHAELMRVREVMKTGPSCARQRRVYADTGDFTRVVDSVVRELRDSVPVAGD